LTIALAVFTTFPLFNTFRASLEAYFLKSLMPKTISNTILGYLNQFASKATRLSAFGAVGLIVTAVLMMLTIDRAFNHIWRVKTARPLAQQMVVYWAIMTLGPLLVGMSITVTSYVFTATSGWIANTSFTGALLYTMISILLTTGAFTLLYITVPNRTVDWRDAACGGFLAATAFELAKRIFVVFITQFPTYTMIYGALAAMPIFLVWIYVSWLITLMGAVLAAALPGVKYERWRHVATPGSIFMDAMAVLQVLCQARATGNAAVDAQTIRSETRLGFDESEALLEKMLEAGWVGRIKADLPKRVSLLGRRSGNGMDKWALLANPRQLNLADIYHLFVFSKTADSALAEKVENAVDRGLNESLESYFSTRA
jgi:membrane protein